ncbi:unnamed protein product [Lampetra fluviatilis]
MPAADAAGGGGGGDGPQRGRGAVRVGDRNFAQLHTSKLRIPTARPSQRGGKAADAVDAPGLLRSIVRGRFSLPKTLAGAA